MNCNAFDVKFDEKKDEIPPKACRPSKKLNKKQCARSGPQTNETTKNQCAKSGPQTSEKTNNVQQLKKQKNGRVSFILFISQTETGRVSSHIN